MVPGALGVLLAHPVPEVLPCPWVHPARGVLVVAVVGEGVVAVEAGKTSYPF